MRLATDRNGLAITVLLSFAIAAPVSGGLPEGFEPYLEMQDQFALALPEGWSVLDQMRLQWRLVSAGFASRDVRTTATRH